MVKFLVSLVTLVSLVPLVTHGEPIEVSRHTAQHTALIKAIEVKCGEAPVIRQSPQYTVYSDGSVGSVEWVVDSCPPVTSKVQQLIYTVSFTPPVTWENGDPIGPEEILSYQITYDNGGIHMVACIYNLCSIPTDTVYLPTQ